MADESHCYMWSSIKFPMLLWSTRSTWRCFVRGICPSTRKLIFLNWLYVCLLFTNSIHGILSGVILSSVSFTPSDHFINIFSTFIHSHKQIQNKNITRRSLFSFIFSLPVTQSHNRSDLTEEPWEAAFQGRGRKYRRYEKGRRDNRTWSARVGGEVGKPR